MKTNYFIVIGLILLLSAGRSQAQCSTPSPPTVTGATVAPCVPNAIFTLTANGSFPFGWYANSWGGNAISNNTVFTTPVITSGATYYVGQSQTVTTTSVTLPSVVTSYGPETRGMWFTAPVSFIITGLRVPTDVGGSSNSALAVLKFPSTPPSYPTVINTFTTLYLNQSIAGTAIVPVYIPVFAGDVIGFLGARNNTTSYGPINPVSTTIGTTAVTLTRLGMQYPLSTQTPTDIWQETGGNLGRVEVYTDIGCLSSLVPVTVTVTPVPPITISAPGASVCTNSTVTLTASGVSTYTWFTGTNGSTVAVTPNTVTTYTVAGSINPSCTSTAAITLSVNVGVPNLTVTQSGLGGGICPNSSLVLTASGAATYTWTGGSTTVTNGVAFNPTNSATYVVTGGNSCGTSTAATSVSVHPFPNVTATSSSPSLCAGSSLTLTGVGNATAYAWSGASGITNGVGFVPGTSTNYTVIGTSALSCTAAATVSVPVFASPNIPPIAQPALICIGNSSTLTATGAAGYTWTGGSSTGNNGTYVVTPSAPGISTYTVLRSNSTCTTSQQISVVTNSLPIAFAIVSGPTLVCASTAVTLAVAGGQTYTWTSPGNPPITPSFSFTGANPVVFPPVNTIYTVAAHDGTCVNTTTVAVGTNPNPTLMTAPSSSMICQGETVTLSVTGGNNYTWTSTSSMPVVTAASFTDMPLVPTAYNVTGDNSFGCTSSAVQIVLVNTSPTLAAGVVANKTLVCNGGTSSLTVSGADSYTWSGGNASGSNTLVVVTSTNTSSGPVIYTISGTSTLTQCSSSKTIAVNVFIPHLTVSGNTIACIGGPISLNASGGNNGWSWQTPGNPPSNGFSSLNTTISAAAVFTVSANTNTLSLSCPGSATVGVDVYPGPSITAVAQRTTICIKESVVLTAGGGTAYVWSNNLAQTNTISVSPGTNTTYTVTGTDLNGCSNTGTVNVKVLGCTGINELGANSGLSIYPNPNSGDFFIQSDSDARLTLVNELGQIVRTIILIGSNNYKVQINDVAQGVYFLTGQKENSTINQKIIVTN